MYIYSYNGDILTEFGGWAEFKLRQYCEFETLKIIPSLLPFLSPTTGQVEDLKKTRDDLEADVMKKREVITDLKGYKREYGSLRQKVGGACCLDNCLVVTMVMHVQ